MHISLKNTQKLFSFSRSSCLCVNFSLTVFSTSEKKSFHLDFFIFCRFGHRRKLKIIHTRKAKIFLWISPQKIEIFLADLLLHFAWTAEFSRLRPKFMWNNLAFKAHKNVSNDLDWILLRHILSWEMRGGRFRTI